MVSKMKSGKLQIAGLALLLLAAGVYWWIYYAATHDLEMEVIGFQGNITVNGTRLDNSVTRFNAHNAKINVAGDGMFNGKLEDGSYIQLVENSAVHINEARRNKEAFKIRTRFTLDTGQIIRDIPEVETITDYSSSLITDSVNIGIRGTRYAAIADDKITRTMLYHGAVELEKEGHTNLSLKQGYGTVTELNKAPEPPVKLPPPPTNLSSDDGDRIVTRHWNISWEAVAGAHSYHVEVARDKQFRNLVARKKSESNHIVIDDLPYDARFYWRVASVDERKLRGDGSSSGEIDYKYHHEIIRQLNGKSDQISVLIDKALEGYPDDIQLLKDIGKYFYRIKSYQHAIIYYDKALEREPLNNEILLERGRAYQGLGHMEKAEADFDKTLSIKANDAEAYWSLGTVGFTEGRVEDSIEYFYRAIASEPNHQQAHLSAADAWIEIGQPEKARQHLELHLENYPDDQQATQQLKELGK